MFLVEVLVSTPVTDGDTARTLLCLERITLSPGAWSPEPALCMRPSPCLLAKKEALCVLVCVWGGVQGLSEPFRSECQPAEGWGPYVA